MLGTDNEDKLPVTCMRGNIFQTQANGETQQQEPLKIASKDKLQCHNLSVESCDKANGNRYRYSCQDMNQPRDSMIISEELNLVPNQMRPPQAKPKECQQTPEEKHENLDRSPRMTNPNPIIINVKEAKENACQHQPLDVQLIKYQRRENNIKLFEQTIGEVEEDQQKAKELLFQEQILENKRIEDQLIKVRISRQ